MAKIKWPRKFTMTTTKEERETLEKLREHFATRDVREAILKAARQILKSE